MTDASPAAGLKVAVFGFDLGEASQIRRIRALLALGCKITSFCQRREGTPDFTPEWENVDLGLVRHGDIKGRSIALGRSVLRAMGHWRSIAEADIFIARNLDLAIIASVTQRLAAMRAGRARAPLVYECLDIHDLMTAEGRKGKIIRWAERHILDQAALLVVSSPGFITNYFKSYQDHDGPFAIIENKLWLGTQSSDRPCRPAAPVPGDGPLVLGLVGSIRCQTSVELLFRTADLMGDRIRIRFAGALHEHALNNFHQELAKRPNCEWTGRYSYPDGLPDAYAGCDLVWAQDMWQRNTNSDWLLPNRLYEASWCGCPSIGLADTQTGRKIVADKLGWVISDESPAMLVNLLNRLERSEIAARAATLRDRPESNFIQSPRELLPMLAPALSHGAGSQREETRKPDLKTGCGQDV
ncbi:glycosyltransferase [Paracoccus seriniphilus]|uniref:glycosyltransferase n=1 Tax=Paracoccus seriniphilus TaxID=184748 RepID=UPI00356ACC22